MTCFHIQITFRVRQVRTPSHYSGATGLSQITGNVTVCSLIAPHYWPFVRVIRLSPMADWKWFRTQSDTECVSMTSSCSCFLFSFSFFLFLFLLETVIASVIHLLYSWKVIIIKWNFHPSSLWWDTRDHIGHLTYNSTQNTCMFELIDAEWPIYASVN